MISLRLCLLATLLAGALPSQVLAMEADHADDVCPPDADPCVVSEVFEVVPESRLDFGLRDVEVTGGGRFEFVDGGGRIYCGSFRAHSNGPVIRTIRPLGSDYFDNEGTRIQTRKECSAGTPAYGCMFDNHCNLGTCGTRYCTGRDRECEADSDCQLGTCRTNGFCSNMLLTCDSNADCDLGTCSTETSCDYHYSGKRSCTANADCQLGTCSGGDGSIELDAEINARSPMSVWVDIFAAGDIVVTAPINLSSRSSESDGGELYIESVQGDVTVSEKIRARGGHLSRGGIVDLVAGKDVVVLEDVLVPGGDFDGGEVNVRADRDIRFEGNVRAESRGGAGFGGYVYMRADGDVSVGPGSQSSHQLFNLDGHKGQFDYAGDGGIFDIVADGNVSVAEGVKIRARGSSGEGAYGGAIFIEADGDVAFDGAFDGVGRSRDGEGGIADFEAGGSLTLGSSSILDVSGGIQPGSEIELDAGGDVTLAGSLVAVQPGCPFAPEILVDSDGDLLVAGSVLTGGSERAAIRLNACRIDLASTAALQSDSALAENELIAHESMVLQAGSSVVVKSGINELIHRAPEKPPVVDGVVEPAPTIVLNAALDGCPECGNFEVDQDETCDDGNVADGDGCSGMCLVE